MTEETKALDVEQPPSMAPLDKLVDWAKAPTVNELKQDLLDAQPIHNTHVTRVREWLDNLNVRGQSQPKKVAGSSSIQPKLIRKQAEWRYPALSEPFLSEPDMFSVEPVTFEDGPAAKQNELVLNNQLNTKIDKVSFIDEYVRTIVDEGTVMVYIGWAFEEEEYEAQEPTYEFHSDHSFGPMHEHLAQLKASNPAQYEAEVPQELKDAHDLTQEQGIPLKPMVNGSQRVAKKKTMKNHPTLEVCDFRNTVVDPTCMGDIEKAGFIIRTYESCKADLRKYPKRYKNIDQIDANANTILGSPDHSPSEDRTGQTFNFNDDARQKFVVYMYWGRRDLFGNGKLVPFVAEWVGNVMIRMELAPVPQAGLPFVLEQYLPVRKSNYGEPDGELLEDNQKVVGAVTRGMVDLMGKSANAQTGIRKDMLDATNKRKFEKGQDYEFNPNVDPRQGVYQHLFPEIPNSAQFMLQLQNAEAESLTGVKSWSQGVGGQALGDVAAGVRGALDAASKRELSILRRLSNGLVKIGRKLIAFNAELLSDVEIIRITNDQFVPVRRDDLQGNFDLKLTISTAEQVHNQIERLTFLLQTVGPNADPNLVRMILARIAKLDKMPELAHEIENFQPQPDPLAQKRAELELAKMDAEIAKLKAETQLVLVEAGLSNAKAGTEGARAAHLKSVTDKQNLDFVEQESGVQQERDLQKHQAQATAQAKLAVVQHHLDSKQDAQQQHHDLLKTYLQSKDKKAANN